MKNIRLLALLPLLNGCFFFFVIPLSPTACVRIDALAGDQITLQDGQRVTVKRITGRCGNERYPLHAVVARD